MSNDILNSREELAKIDKSNMLGSIEALAKQVEHAWTDTQNITFPKKSKIENVVVAGMGGSGLGADVIKNLFKSELKIPFDFIHSYDLPNYVNQNTLVILSSYSGTTEETLAGAKDAINRDAQVAVISAGGKLSELAATHGWPIYRIDPIHNPCNQPRMAIGYSVFGTIDLCHQAGIISLSDEKVRAVQVTIKQQLAKCSVEVKADKNPAKMLAYAMLDRRGILVGAEFLEGAVHVGANQINENAKAFADYKVIPEINHHLMEGLKYPKTNSHTHVMFFVNSKLYHPKNQKRMTITQELVDENGIETIAVEMTAKTKIEQVFETITLFAFAGYYLSMLEGIDPSPIPFVDSFKAKLK